jgi:hypothetical protein
MESLILRQFACDTRKARSRNVLRKAKRAFNLMSDALPFGGLWHVEPDATSYAKLRIWQYD